MDLSGRNSGYGNRKQNWRTNEDGDESIGFKHSYEAVDSSSSFFSWASPGVVAGSVLQ